MGAFSAVVAARPKQALRVVELPPSAYADGWGSKPSAPVRVGLRLISDAEIQTARGEAVRAAMTLHPHADAAQASQDPNWIDAFNDALMRWAVARATCVPEDISKPFFPVAEDTVKEALTSQGIKALFEALELLVVEQSPLSPEATDEDLGDLVQVLQHGAALTKMPPGEARALRRLLGHALERLVRYDVER